MNKKGLKLALTALLAVSQAFALSEVRTPWIASSGPLRYMFEKHDENQKYALNMWSAAHTKYANRAFTKNGFKTREISELIFNKSTFSLGEAAFGSEGDPSGATYNPLADAKTVAPRVEYSEMGMTLGGEVSMPVGKTNGRLGIRGSVPFRSIEMERLDSGLDKAEDPAKDYVANKVIRAFEPNVGDRDVTVGYNAPAVFAKAYRLDMVAKLPGLNGDPVLSAPAGNSGITLFNVQLGDAAGAVGANTVAIAASAPGSSNPVLPATYGYSLSTGAAATNNTTVNLSVFHDTQAADASNDGGVVVLANNLANLTTVAKYINSINQAGDYSAAVAAKTPAGLKKNWLVFRRSSNSNDAGEKYTDGANGGDGASLVRALDQTIAQYTQNAFAYLAAKGYSLDSQNRVGMGDIDLDVFYDHALHEDWNAEAVVGVRLPTGASKNKFGTPYRALLGNGEHFEVKLGGMLAWQPLTWMNVKADASYSFVLESKENRMAVFAGSTIKNMGPQAAADVDWGYFKGHFDMNFFHPKTSDIRSTLGYEFYYKTKDNVSYKSATALAFDGSTTHAVDNKLAAANTESMAHKLRFETSYQLSQYLELFCGGSYTFAGQNVMRDADTHGGFNVRF